MKPATRSGLLAPAGLLVGPTLWAASTQAGQILPYWSCGSPWHPPALLALPAALASLAAAWLSWRASQPSVWPTGKTSPYPASYGFMGRISALSGLIFAYALTLQGLSALVLTGCER
jgi:hypothetical protein